MKNLQTIESLTALKVLGDPRRVNILRLLMAAPATLSQVGRALEMHPAKIRHHLKQLEDAGFVALESLREIPGFVEKYYQATAQAFMLNRMLLPELSQQGTIYCLGSHDPALELLAAFLGTDDKTPAMVALPIGSLDGLIALRQGFCHIAGCHLFDPVGGEYNISYVRHLFPGQAMRVVTLAHREQGLLVVPGNPLQLQGLEDLTHERVTFINRKSGSGTRLWLDQQLSVLGLESSRIHGYTTEVNTHSQVAEAVLQGSADVGLAVFAAARKFNLGFVPLFEERFDLVMRENESSNPLLIPLFDALTNLEIRMEIIGLRGYRTAETGNVIQVI
jgi:putative molybdopterin biosynthesis protein